MSVLHELEPREVFRYFEAICDIPHGSKNTKILSDYCALFARIRGLRCEQDKADNVIIWKKGTPGYEDHPPILLQGHLDMVCEKEKDVQIDFKEDGLSLAIEDGYVRAQGTTLGGDNGIAVAMLLALLDSRSIPHPPLEVVFTSDEEIGMIGANALDVSPLKSKTMINLDSEDEGVLTVSCAGGVKASLLLPLKKEKKQGVSLTLELNGLSGGHSGVDILGDHVNAIHYTNTLLSALMPFAKDLRIVDWQGGGMDNAIPRAASLRVLAIGGIDEGYGDAIRAAMDALREHEPDAVLTVKKEEHANLWVFTPESNQKAIKLITDSPNGVQSMSEDIKGLVQTSLNLGILSTSRDEMRAVYAIRSSVDKERFALAKRLEELILSLGGKYKETGSYPAWEYRQDSPIRDLANATFRRLFGGDCRIEAIHAGLECGVFSGKIKGLDCISMGPDMHDVHTPRERLSITSVQRTWLHLTEILKAL